MNLTWEANIDHRSQPILRGVAEEMCNLEHETKGLQRDLVRITTTSLHIAFCTVSSTCKDSFSCVIFQLGYNLIR
jgi:hypothetical protein